MGFTKHQTSILFKFINEFALQEKTTDCISVNSTPDNDLLLYRRSSKGLVNIIIHPEDDFAFSFIGKGDRVLEFYSPDTVDFTKLAQKFLIS